MLGDCARGWTGLESLILPIVLPFSICQASHCNLPSIGGGVILQSLFVKSHRFWVTSALESDGQIQDHWESQQSFMKPPWESGREAQYLEHHFVQCVMQSGQKMTLKHFEHLWACVSRFEHCKFEIRFGFMFEWQHTAAYSQDSRREIGQSSACRQRWKHAGWILLVPDSQPYNCCIYTLNTYVYIYRFCGPISFPIGFYIRRRYPVPGTSLHSNTFQYLQLFLFYLLLFLLMFQLICFACFSLFCLRSSCSSLCSFPHHLIQ